jgi:hypothetical protein
MNKNLTRIVVSSAIVSVGLLAVGMMATPKPISRQQPASTPRSLPPDQVVYGAFFHFVVELQKEATDLENEGKKGDTLRSYIQTQSGLNDEEARELDEIAVACVEQISQQDARALTVIQKFQSQFPGGKVPAGMKLPPPPAELTELQQERDQIVLAAKSQLAAELGDASFDKVAKFAERRIAFKPQTGSSGR